eukprot:jgi/Ulvmu1/10643/UM066_0023.1
MAEWGKGDERWIVDERKDGQNVNAWHWSEKDCINWTRQRMAQLFDGIVLVDQGAVSSKVTGVDKVEGEAFLNIRKKKLIPSYELKIVLSFDGSADGEGVSGKVVLPYVAEENHDEDPEVQVKPDKDTAAGQTVKDAIYSNRAKAIFPPIQTFIAEFHAGKAAGGSEDAEQPAKTTVTDHSTSKPSAPAATAATPPPAKPSKTVDKTKRGTRKLEIKETFYASAGDIYEVFTNEARVKGFTQSDATISRDVGGEFKMFGGSIEGVQRTLEPGKLIVQDWRFTTWPDGLYSKVTLAIDEPEPGHTVVVMTQEGIPEEDKFGNHDVVGTTEHGWRQLIFFKIKAVFGYGI